MENPPHIRPANAADRPLLMQLLDAALFQHAHPDWQTPLSWLGHSPFYLAQRGDKLLAALATPPDPPDTAWVRLAAFRNPDQIDTLLAELWAPTETNLRKLGTERVAALVLDSWLVPHLQRLGFEFLCDVVNLQRYGGALPPVEPASGLKIRRARLADVPQITSVDNMAFAAPWQYSEKFIQQAVQWANYATVIHDNERIVGYQMCTGGQGGAHLARLAVLPDWQNRAIGRWLVTDLLNHYLGRLNAPYVTVNTQSNNPSSLRLYTRLGFAQTREIYPVWQKNL